MPLVNQEGLNLPAALAAPNLLLVDLNQGVTVLLSPFLEVLVLVSHLLAALVLPNHLLEALNQEALALHQRVLQETQEVLTAQAAPKEVYYQYLFLFHGDLTIPIMEATTAHSRL